MNKTILVSWIGHADLWAMGRALNEENIKVRIAEVIGKGSSHYEKGEGPVKTLVSQRKFDEIHFLTQWPDDLNRRFESWLGVKATFHGIGKDRLSDPTSYEQVFNVSRCELEVVRKNNHEGAISILLSPGTPTMTAVWVLLGKTMFPATFLQTYKGKVTEVSIPFDVTLDVIPDYLRYPDAQLQQLALANPGEVKGFEQVKGNSKALMVAISRAERAAIRDVEVLLTGESGTGKELFARAMHCASHRGRQDQGLANFVALNCAAIPETLFESELFGVERGAYTDAKESRPGAFERANGGTLFLDEVGELSPQNQAKLLRALQPVSDPNREPCSRMVRRVGGKTDITCDVRIIAATNRDLVEAIKNHQFRDDLFYRLAVIQIRLPALRDRRTDIEVLAGEILRRVNSDFIRTESGYENRRLTPDGLRRLRKHNWPGNVRELHNVLTQAAVFALSPEITGADIDSAIATFDSSAEESTFSRSRRDDFVLSDRLQEIERVFIEDAMNETDGNQTKAAKLLGISQQALSKKLKRRADIGT